MAIVKLAEVRTDAAIKRVFDTLYPADPYGSVAYAVEVDDSFFVINGNENMDRDQFFKMKLGDGVLNTMEGKLPFENIIFGKREGTDRYWFQTNGYRGDGVTPGQRYVCTPKPTAITFTCAKNPVVAVEDGKQARMTIIAPWIEQTKSLTLSFEHTDGAVSFRIQAH
jgi:hypothetical protein